MSVTKQFTMKELIILAKFRLVYDSLPKKIKKDALIAHLNKKHPTGVSELQMNAFLTTKRTYKLSQTNALLLEWRVKNNKKSSSHGKRSIEEMMSLMFDNEKKQSEESVHESKKKNQKKKDEFVEAWLISDQRKLRFSNENVTKMTKNEINSIIPGFESLEIKCAKIMHTKNFEVRFAIPNLLPLKAEDVALEWFRYWQALHTDERSNLQMKSKKSLALDLYLLRCTIEGRHSMIHLLSKLDQMVFKKQSEMTQKIHHNTKYFVWHRFLDKWVVSPALFSKMTSYSEEKQSEYILTRKFKEFWRRKCAETLGFAGKIKIPMILCLWGLKCVSMKHTKCTVAIGRVSNANGCISRDVDLNETHYTHDSYNQKFMSFDSKGNMIRTGSCELVVKQCSSAIVFASKDKAVNQWAEMCFWQLEIGKDGCENAMPVKMFDKFLHYSLASYMKDAVEKEKAVVFGVSEIGETDKHCIVYNHK